MADRLPDRDEVRRRVDEIFARAEDGRMVLVGKSRGDPVSLADPSHLWATDFRQIRARLADALGEHVVRIEHIGSTSIPGIAAKPVIDIQVTVPDIAKESAFVPAIESLGWPLRSREPGHLYFRDPAGTPRRVQIHVCQVGSDWERNHLLFRDYLRAHPDAARAYEALKQAAAQEYPNDRLAYTEAKGPFIEGVLARAEEWAGATGWRPGG